MYAANLFNYADQVKDITTMKAAEVQISYRRTHNYNDLGVINSPEVAAPILRAAFPEGVIEYKEFFFVLLIDRAGHVLGTHKVSEGGTSATTVDLKIILQAAILANASALILCHNHPSGSLRPSIEDDKLTKKITDAARLVDIRVNDHIILTADSHFSYADEGRL